MFQDLGGTVLFPDLLFPDICGTMLFPDLCGTMLFRDLCGTMLFPDLFGSTLFPDTTERAFRNTALKKELGLMAYVFLKYNRVHS